MRTNNSRWMRALWSALLSAAMSAGVLATPTTAAAQDATVHLIAAPVTKAITLPNGTVVNVPMWGYALDLNDSNTVDGSEVVTVPGPRITVPVGGNLTVTLTNLLPEATSIIIPGQPYAAAPERNANLRARSMTTETLAGNTGSYVFTGLRPGTFLYQSGSHVQTQVQMGLYGAMTKDASAGQAYAGIAAYSAEAVLLFSEIDEALHAAVNAGTYGTNSGPTSAVNYKPSIFLINGESYTNSSMAAIPAGAANGVTLLRMLNAGLRQHAPVIDNSSFTIIAEDGNKLPFGRAQATVMLAAGKTHDVLWAPTADGDYTVYDRILGLNAPGQAGAGMLARLHVQTGANTDPVQAANDNVAGTEDGAITGTSLINASVLGNDTGTGTLTAEQLTAPGAGGLVFNTDGTFTYTPNPNFFGVDSFTYRATNGTDTSKPATVLITVNGVPDAPIASSPTLGVDFDGNANIPLTATDADGDALKFYITVLPTNGALSYINPISKVETPLGPGDVRTAAVLPATAGTGGTMIPGGNILYRPTAGYDGPDSFHFVAFDGALDSTVGGQVTITVHPTDQDSPVSGLTQQVTLHVKGNDNSDILNYRWTLEEDTTYEVTPGILDANTLAVRFHTSFTPVVSAGTDADPIMVNPAKRYFVSVLPTENNYSNTGGAIGAGVTEVTVTSSKLPLPTARIRVQVFEDNAPLDGMLSGTEAGLAGFQVTIDDAGGTYGMSGGHQSTDAFGNKIGTLYEPCDPGPCDSYQVTKLGDGFVLTDADGIATIENLPMGKYTVKVRAPGGEKWIQTTTIEGTPGIDAWVKPNEPKFFTEFGPPGPHVLVGFVRAAPTVPAGPFAGSGSITGRVTNMRMSRPPDVTQSSGAPFAQFRPWVALNSALTGGQLLYAQPTAEDGSFTISGVADGSYSLVVFDSALDVIIANRTVDVVGSDPTALGDVPVFQWFANLYSFVYEDTNRNGHHDPGEKGIADQALNIRFRDGSIYQSLSTGEDGFKAFNEVFPFFAWLVAEVDYARYHSTGVTVVVDNGGTASAENDWQAQAGLPPGLIPPNVLNPQPQAENGNKPYRDESGAETPFLLLEGFQAFLGQSNVMLWGKAPYEKVADVVEDVNVAPLDAFPACDPENPTVCDVDANGDGFFNTDRTNGGIAGIVHYTITRAENDPRWATAENWEPGVSDVRIQLWDENRTHLLNEVTTDNWNNSLPAGCQGPVFTFLGQPTDCYDGLRNFNQARPALFDGGYAFSTILQDSVDSPTYNLPVADRKVERPLPAGKYVVKMIVPPGYQVQREEDKNVDFGDQYIPQQFWLDGYALADAAPEPLTLLAADVTPVQTTIQLTAGGGTAIHPNDVINVENEVMRVTATVGDTLTVIRAQSESLGAAHLAGTEVYSHDAQPAATATDNALIAPFCVGALHTVPNELNLFPGVTGAYGGEQRPLCDAKLVVLREGQQVAPDFHLLTVAPKAGHIYGMVLDDTTNEFDPNAPTFGEKYAPPYMPISIRDWQGREIAHTYTDQYGMYNALVPSTYTIQVPQPSGVAPSILQACINSPTKANPDGSIVAEPLFQKQYSHFCYPLQYLPGKTTYLDTPVLPTGAFTGTGTFPVDSELPNHTPIIASVNGTALNLGPYIVDNGAGDDASRTIVIKSAGNVEVVNPAYDGPGSVQPKLITRDYGFGSAPSLNNAGFVTLGGQRLPYTSWTPTAITVVVPSLPASPTNGQLAASRTGELIIERCLDGKTGATDTITGKCNDGRKAVLGVTLNVATPNMHANRPPTIVNAGESIQAAIDAATAGDLILVAPGTYEEMVVMTKPVRLQGAGALSTIINVVTTPSENVQAWLDYTGQKLLDNPDYLLPGQPVMTPGPFTVGDVAAVLGDEGAGITVLGKNQPTVGLIGIETGICLGGFESPTNEAYCLHNENNTADNLYNLTTPWLRPNARIDGFSIIGANDAPGIRVNGNNHYLEISNNKIFTNTGNFAGGIELGHVGRIELQNVNAHVQFSAIHNNLIAQNAGLGTTGGAGVVLGTGSGMYRVMDNFIAGNFSAGNGAGISHIGNADLTEGTVEHPFPLIYPFAKPTYWGNTTEAPSAENNVSVIKGNTIVFNESFSQGVGTNGGGIYVGGTPPPAGGTYIGTGSVRINSNLIQGNGASGGDGGGVALQGLNGSHVVLYNNIIANNVAGFAGGGISLQDVINPASPPASASASNVEIVHNTVVNNDSLAVAGAAFTFVGDPNRSVPQPAGIFVRNAGTANNPKITNSIVTHNRSYYFGITSNGGLQIPGTITTRGLIACTTSPCTADGYRDTGRVGSAATLTMFGTTTSATAAASQPSFLRQYVNTDRRNSYQQAEVTTILAPAALDEGGNFIRPQFGPLSLTKLDDTRFANYHTSVGVNGINLAGTVASGGYGVGNVPASLNFDIDAEIRPVALPDRGVDEVLAGLVLPPVAVNDTVNTPLDTAVTISVLSNDTGTAPLTVTGVSQLVGGTATTDGVTVTFTPTTGFNGQASFSYSISGVGGEAAAVVYVNVGDPKPVLSLDPTFASFGNVAMGATSAGKTITVSNTGNDVMTITSIAVTGADAGDFAIASNACGATLAAGASCQVTVTFGPTALSSRHAQLAVTVDAPATSLSASLSGTGVNTTLTVNPTSLNFGTLTVNQTSAAQTLTLTNTGNTFAEFTAVSTSADYAVVAGTCPAGSAPGTMQVVAGGTCTIGVTFTPSSAASVSATLTLAPGIGNPVVVALSGAGAAVDVTAAPASLSFGNVTIGTPSALPVTITNNGGAAVQLALSFTGTNAAQFSQSGCPASLASGASCNANVTLTPTGGAGARSANFIVTPVGNPALAPITLSGTAVTGSITALPATLAFGAVPVGSSSAAQLVTITNTGTAPVKVTMAALAGTDPSQFAALSGCPTIISNVAGSNTCTVSVTFSPTSIGAKAASVSFVPSNGTTRVVNMTGTGVILQSSVTSLAFGNVTIGTPKSMDVVLTNTGASSMAAPALSFTGTHASQFSETDDCGSGLAAGASCTVTVTLVPSGSNGARSASLLASVGAETRTVTMTANAVTGSITALPATRAFGTQPLNLETAPLTVTVTNAGTAPVQLTISAISGSSFAKTTTCPAILTNVAGSNTCTIDVTFTPITVGAKSESFTVAPSSGTVRTVTLTGTGTILVAPASLAFGIVSVNTTNTLMTTVSNPGTQPLTINAVTFAGGGASQYVATTCAGGVVAAGGTCDVNVSLTPTSGGGKNATMTLDFGAAGTRNVSLTGSAVNGSIQVNGATTATLAFGSQTVGTISATQTVTVSNVGTGLLTITSIALGGANPGQYVIQSNTCTSPIAAGGTCTVDVAFAPTNPTGSKPATLVVTPSSGAARTVTLTGTAN